MSLTFPQRLIEANWVITPRSERLHYAELNPQQARIIVDRGDCRGDIRLGCGWMTGIVMMPDSDMRVDWPRCGNCCLRTGFGYPAGKGSPKNDIACEDAYLHRVLKDRAFTTDFTLRMHRQSKSRAHA